MLRMIGIGAFALAVWVAPAAAQQDGARNRDIRTEGAKAADERARQREAEARAKAGEASAAQSAAPACSQLKVAQNAVYSAYIRLVVADLPDASAGVAPDEMAEKLKDLYDKQVAAAQDGDVAALRKTAALEIFAMQLKQAPIADFTRSKLCLFAGEPQPGFGVLDNLACAVTSIDSANRELHKPAAKAAMDKARALVPADANAASTDKLLLDDVTRGLAGCM